MANPQEVQRARDAFGQWFPRHGALQTRKNDLYVAMHAALQAGQVDRHSLVSLGNGLKTALAQRNRNEVKTVVETAEAIHKAHGFRSAMSYLTGELQPAAHISQVARAKPTSGAPARVLPTLFRLIGTDLRYIGIKPSEVLAEVRKALGPIELERASRVSARHARLLSRASSLAHNFYMTTQLHLAISQKTELEVDKVEKMLLPLYDKAFEKIYPTAHGCIQGVLQSMAKGELDNKNFEKAVALYSAAVDRIADIYAKKKAKSSWTAYPNVLEDVRMELIPISFPGAREGPPVTVARLEQVLKKHVDAYVGKNA